jgi:hypothetical protein
MATSSNSHTIGACMTLRRQAAFVEEFPAKDDYARRRSPK